MVAHIFHGVLTGSYRYTTLTDVTLVERAFGIGPSALTEAMGMLNHHFAAAA